MKLKKMRNRSTYQSAYNFKRTSNSLEILIVTLYHTSSLQSYLITFIRRLLLEIYWLLLGFRQAGIRWWMSICDALQLRHKHIQKTNKHFDLCIVVQLIVVIYKINDQTGEVNRQLTNTGKQHQKWTYVNTQTCK